MNYTQLAGQYIGQHHNPDLIRKRLQEPPQIHVLHAQTGNLLSVLDNKGDNIFWDSNHIRKLKNNEERLSFTTLPDNECAEYLRERNRVVIPDGGGFYREFIIVESIQQQGQLQIEAVASYVDLGKEKPLEPNLYEGQTVNTIMDLILYATSWQRGITEYSGSRQFELEDYTTPYEAMRKVASTFEVELRFRIETLGGRVIGRYVDAIERVGGWHGREIVSGVDLISAERRENTTELVTALVGLGPQKEDGTRVKVEVMSEEAFQNWGEGDHLWGKHEVESDNTEMTVAEVEQYTTTELNKRIAAAVQYKVEGANLEHLPEFQNKEIHLGDDVRIKATEFNPPMYLDARIIEIEGPISDRKQEVYTLGEFIEYTEAEINALKKQFKRLLAKKLEYKQLEEFTYDKAEIAQLDTNVKDYADTQDTGVYQDSTLYTDQQKQNLTNEIENGLVSIPGGSIGGFIELANTTLRNATSNVYTDNDGNFFFIDPNDNNLVVKISSQGVGVSTSGVIGPFTNAMTGLGINATAIVTGFMSFDRARGGFLQIGGADNDLGRFIVYGSNGTPVADIDHERASIQNLTTETFSSPDVPRLNTESYIMRVDPLDGDDRNTGLGPWGTTGLEGPLRTMAEAARRLPDINEGDIEIQYHYYNSRDVNEGLVELKGIQGGGKVTINGQTVDTTVGGHMVIDGCGCKVDVRLVTFNSANVASTYSVINSNVDFFNAYAYGNGTTEQGIYYEDGAKGTAENCQQYDHTFACVRASGPTHIYVKDSKGLSERAGLRADNSAYIGVEGTVPGGILVNREDWYGATIKGNATVDTGAATPPAPPEETETWTANDAGTWHLTLNLWDDYYGATPTQGEWRGAGPYSGFWFFGADLSNTVTGKSITGIQAYIKRQGSGGKSGLIRHYIRWHGHAGQPTSPSDETLSSDVVTVDLRTGDSAWVELPESFVTAFENGTAKGMGLYTSDTSDSSYTSLTQGAKLKITYQ